MARPLKYDDQFRNIISSNLHSNFLFCIKLKVSNTTFCGRSNLQKGLRVLGIIDIVFFFLFIIFKRRYSHIAFIEKVLFYSTGIFGVIALDASKNLKKVNSFVYYYWRIGLIILLPCYELSDYLNLEECYFLSTYCHWIAFVGITVAYICISLYLTKIAWTFAIQIQNGNELLILHGSYLEQMLNDENIKIKQNNFYIPPQIMRNGNKDTKVIYNQHNNKDSDSDHEQINQIQFKIGVSDNNKEFRNINPFKNALNTIGLD